MSSFEGYVDYQKREYCNDVQCPVQLDLNKEKMGSEKYEEIRQECIHRCRHTTYEFHQWLIKKGYLIIRKN